MSARTRIRTTALRGMGVLLVTAAMLASGPGAGVPVIAHGYVAESSPADGEVLSEGPVDVRVVFTEPFEPGVSSLTLVDSAGQEVPGTLEHLDGNTEMRLVLQEALPAGSYRIDWRILATDGHVTEGTIAFTVEGTAAQPEEPVASEAAAPEGEEPQEPADPQPTAPEAQEAAEPAEAPGAGGEAGRGTVGGSDDDAIRDDAAGAADAGEADAARAAGRVSMLPLLAAVVVVVGAAILVIRRWRS